MGIAASDTANLPIACLQRERRDQERTSGTVPRAQQQLFTKATRKKGKDRESANMGMHTNELPHKIIISHTDGNSFTLLSFNEALIILIWLRRKSRLTFKLRCVWISAGQDQLFE